MRETTTAKTALCLARRDFDPTLLPHATVVDEDASYGEEWLYDITGLRYDNEGFLARFALAAECEWGPEHRIYYGFVKLLLARADLRVMVFDGTPQLRYGELFRVFAQYIGRCAHTEIGDVWLFAAWTQERFVYHYLVAIDSQGTLD